MRYPRPLELLPLEALIISKPEQPVWKEGPQGPYPEGVRLLVRPPPLTIGNRPLP